VVVVFALVAAACNNATPPPVASTSTTVGAVPVTTTTTSTTVTLPPPEERETAVVAGVVDGDTFQARRDGEEVTVRLLGVNAPEADECYGDGARTALTDLVAGEEVVLVAGEEDTDPFGRLLRYVYVGAGDPVFVNERLVREGAAVALQNGHRYQEEFKRLEDRAYASGKGMWGTYVCGHGAKGVTPDRPQLRIGELSPDPPGDDAQALDGEWIEILNESYTGVALGGWIVRDESSSNRYTIPGGVGLSPGKSLRLVTGCGSSGGDRLYWCADAPVWNNEGDTVIVEDARGNVVDRKVYTATSG